MKNKLNCTLIAGLSTLIVILIAMLVYQTKMRNKDYEAACHMSDLIRCYEEHLRTDSLIEDYGCFEELEGTFLWDDAVVNEPVNLNKYVWCY